MRGRSWLLCYLAVELVPGRMMQMSSRVWVRVPFSHVLVMVEYTSKRKSLDVILVLSFTSEERNKFEMD